MSGASEIKVDCPKCLTSLEVPAEKGGLRIVCPNCKRSLLVPEAQAAGNTIFDDLFDPPSEEAPDSAASNETSKNPVEPVVEPSQVTLTNNDAEKSGATLADSAFDDIDLALQNHETSGKAVPAVTQPPPQPKPEAPELPPVEVIDEEIELPESTHEPLPEIALEDPTSQYDPLAVLQPAGNADPALDEIDLPESGLPIEEEFSLDEHLEVSDLNLDPISTGDPFQENPDQPINIDGLAPTIKSDDIFGVKCKICDTRIHVNIDQDGKTIQCPDCFSDVLVNLPESGPTVNANKPISNAQLQVDSLENLGDKEAKPANLAETESAPLQAKKPVLDDEILQLAPIAPVQVEIEEPAPPKPQPSYDPAELKKDLEELPDAGEDPLKLAPLDDTPVESGFSSGRDLLTPVPRPKRDDSTNSEPQTEEKKPETIDDLFNEVDSNAATLSSPDEDEKKRGKKKPKNAEFGSKNYWEQKVTEVEPEDINTPEILTTDILMPNHVLGWLSKNFASPEVIFRTLIAISLMAITYVMFDIFHNALNDDNLSQAQKMLGTILPAIFGGLTFAVGIIVWFTTAAMVFQNSCNGVATAEEWPGFSPGDWFGPLALFLFSLWLGSIPGAAFGALCGILLQQNTWIVAMASLTAFVFSPILYSCAAYNGSAFNIFSGPVFKTIRTDDITWLYYLPYTFASWFLFFVGTMILFLPTFVFSTVGAAMQVFALICFASVAGVHAARMVNKLQKK